MVTLIGILGIPKSNWNAKTYARISYQQADAMRRERRIVIQ